MSRLRLAKLEAAFAELAEGAAVQDLVIGDSTIQMRFA
jgi:hypothetical protein